MDLDIKLLLQRVDKILNKKASSSEKYFNWAEKYFCVFIFKQKFKIPQIFNDRAVVNFKVNVPAAAVIIFGLLNLVSLNFETKQSDPIIQILSRV